MDDAVAMGPADRLARVEDVTQELAARYGIAGLGDGGGERAAAHDPHRIERCAVGQAASVVNRDDARVLEARGDAGFARESFFELAAEATLAGVHLFEGDLTREAFVEGLDDPAHAADAQGVAALVALGVGDVERQGLRVGARPQVDGRGVQ